MSRYAMLAVLVLASCSSTGVTPVGDGVYMVGVRRAQAGFGPNPKAEALAYQKANAFCAQQGKAMQRVQFRAESSGFGRPASAILEFRCVEPKSD